MVVDFIPNSVKTYDYMLSVDVLGERCLSAITHITDFTLPYLALPHPTLPYFTLPYLTLPYPSFPYLTLPFPTLPYLTLLFPSFPYLTSPYLTLPHPTLPYLTLPYLTLPYLTLPYPSFPYLTLPYLTSPYLSLPYLTSPYFSLAFPSLPYLTLPYLTLPYVTPQSHHRHHSSSGVGEMLLSVPITADCSVSSLKLTAREIPFGECFIRHPYESELILRRCVLNLMNLFHEHRFTDV